MPRFRSLIHLVPLTVVALSSLAGCSATEPASFASRSFDPVPAREVLDYAAGLLTREFGGIDRGRSADDRLVSNPVLFTTRDGSGSARDFYGGSSDMRRVAVVEVTRRDGRTLLRLRVDVERRDTSRVDATPAPVGGISDTPAYENTRWSDPATTSRQQSVWTRVRRDRAAERKLLDELIERFEPADRTAG